MIQTCLIYSHAYNAQKLSKIHPPKFATSQKQTNKHRNTAVDFEKLFKQNLQNPTLQ